jgi:hypothetical protein
MVLYPGVKQDRPIGAGPRRPMCQPAPAQEALGRQKKLENVKVAEA